jgi:hypothetical protein
MIMPMNRTVRSYKRDNGLHQKKMNVVKFSPDPANPAGKKK